MTNSPTNGHSNGSNGNHLDPVGGALMDIFSSDLPVDRFDGILRDYTVDDIAKLRGSVTIQHTLATKYSAE